ncbi:surface lipoprotein assembly modifier [Chelativorans salis]|uniref:Surface lipoprotein assembly modifier n=1 Tax=Chelativorans salis TaxID=2978478 RepID=A0ABT2LKQ3_9HYPH|nr:surface lipoprotein assembly modifier [Chelativorans sp. EGI FJ00035]MCT7375002.1 surface lipoprotein assembly modifier [Chelativorans sp. EGI FJ00035]
MKILAAFAICLVFSTVANAERLAPEEADAIFMESLSAAQAGRHDIAIRNYRHLLRAVPTARIKLELARSYFSVGKFKQALALFREVYDAPGTPKTVKRNILPFIEEAELHILRVRFGARIVSDSNPARAPSGGTIFFNGIPLEYEPSSPREFAHGFEPWISVEKLWDNGLLTKFNGSARLFEHDELNVLRGRFSVGRMLPSKLFVEASLDAELNEDSPFMRPTLGAWRRFTLSSTSRIGVGGDIGYTFSEDHDRSGQFYRPYLFGDWTFRPNATFFWNASLEHQNALNDYYSYDKPSTTVGLDVKFGGWNVSPNLSASWTRFTEYDPFWRLNRKDVTVRPSFSVSHDRLEWKGIKPEFTIFHEGRDSNVDIYDYHQTGGFISLRRAY